MIMDVKGFTVQPSHRSPAPHSLFVCFDKRRILLTDEEHPALPTLGQVQPLLPEGFVPFELACRGDTLLTSPHPHGQAAPVAEGCGLKYYDFEIYRDLEQETASLLIACNHLWMWYGKNRFCGRCGAPLQPSQNERALCCGQCRNIVFPTIAPAVIVAITQGERILLARNSNSAHTRYSLIAGYVEVGETLEHAVRREVMEEVGLHLKNIRYIGDQPWGVSGAQMFGFTAEAVGDEDIVLDTNELREARWFTREDMPIRSSSFSVAAMLMERFRNRTL